MPAEVMLIESTGGVYEVTVDGVLVHSKAQTGVFPDEAVLLEKLRTM